MQFDFPERLSVFARASAIATYCALWGTDALAQDGEVLFKKNCANCHQIGEGARNKVGPHLDMIIDRIAGVVSEFKYSKALKAAGEEGLKWDQASLDAYLEKPREFIKGNRMSFRGMSDAAERKALITWMAEASDAEPTADLSQSASASAGLAPSFATDILKIEGDPEYGEYLSGDCVTCHQVSGQADGIPSIVGVPEDYFVRALVEYKTNVRVNEVMKNRVANLTNEEIAALAAYFKTLEPQ